MDTPRQDSLLFSPSLKKSFRARSPRKSTPSKLYLRLPFPTIGQQSSTTLRVSPGESFQQRQQLLREALAERELEEQQQQLLDQEPSRDEAAEESHLQEQSATANSASLSSSPRDSASVPASALHARQAQEISETLARILDKSPSSSHNRPQPTDNIPANSLSACAPATQRLRTTETEYDLSPSRSTRLLSTPSPSIYHGTPSRLPPERRGLTRHSEHAEITPLISLSRDRREHDRQDGQKRGALSDITRSTRANIGLFRHDQARTEHTEDEPDREENTLEHGDSVNRVHDSEAVYDHADGEVSFKRVELSLSSHQSTLIEQDGLRQHGQYHSSQAHGDQEQEEEEEDATPDRHLNPSAPRRTYYHSQTHGDLEQEQEPEETTLYRQPNFSTPRRKYYHSQTHEDLEQEQGDTTFNRQLSSTAPLNTGYVTEDEAESALLEVAETTATITDQLRGVYSNLQQFFSPETEAKLNGAISVIGSHKKASRDQSTYTKGLSASIPAPPVFGTSPTGTRRSPIITKRKPAPLRPAIIPKQTPSQPAQQPATSATTRRHDVAVTGLISNADSARRLSQGKSQTSGSPEDNSHELKKTTAEPSARAPRTVPKPFTLETEARSDRHQERFQRRLERWKRVDREHQFKPTPPRVYMDLYIPSKSSRPLTRPEPPILQTDRRAMERQAMERQSMERGREAIRENGRERDKNRHYKDKILQEVRAQIAREDELKKQQGGHERSGVAIGGSNAGRPTSRAEFRKSERPLTVPKSPNIGEKRRRGASKVDERYHTEPSAADDTVNHLDIRAGRPGHSDNSDREHERRDRSKRSSKERRIDRNVEMDEEEQEEVLERNSPRSRRPREEKMFWL
ncbi:hypothetical protein BGZ67_008445 [Mortierella alpina]|nr:hypothetical protein BGZ67_008445 [Mortierella alpina]